MGGSIIEPKSEPRKYSETELRMSKVKGILIGGTLGLFAVCIGKVLQVLSGVSDYSIPRKNNVESGYVVPSKLEIYCKDLDNNGTEETYLKYDGKEYALLVGEDGLPEARHYTIESAKTKILFK